MDNGRGQSSVQLQRIVGNRAGTDKSKPLIYPAARRVFSGAQQRGPQPLAADAAAHLHLRQIGAVRLVGRKTRAQTHRPRQHVAIAGTE